jgi:hypothetical protein
MRQMSLQRRRVVVMAGSVAAMSGAVPMLMLKHPRLGFLWLGFMVLVLVMAIRGMARLKRTEV